MNSDVLHTLQIMADHLDEPDRRALAIMTFEGIFDSTGMVDMGYNLIGLEGEDRKMLSVLIFQHLRHTHFEPGELRIRAGRLLAGISGSLPYEMKREAQRKSKRLLGRADQRQQTVFGTLKSMLPEGAQALSVDASEKDALVEYQGQDGEWYEAEELTKQLSKEVRRWK